MSESERTKPSLPTFDPNNCQTYSASCHCGTVRYEVLLSPPIQQWKVVSCNCSICTRNGYLLVYPERSQLHMKSGEDALRDYSFGPKRNLHKFCRHCGSSVFFDPRMKEFGESPPAPDLLGVNIRMFQSVQIEELDVVQVEDRHQEK
ncbi:Mss4-like protein [Paraphoma chrysanthemicola]|nr:Mss4-like protein [Paraphoma chrysanthemicola]